jgi:Fe-Mn family superoxide dismutase
MEFKLPPLPYAYDALQPYMSAETLQYHHDKHHQAYVDMANKLVPGTKYEGKSIEQICKEAFANKDQPVINNVGQDFNHIHFWQWMKKGGGGNKLPGKVEKLVGQAGGFDKIRNDFIEAGKTQFGSGWAWLALKWRAAVVTPNGENPLMHGATPILGCDVWERYYIDYRNAAEIPRGMVRQSRNWEHVERMVG